MLKSKNQIRWMSCKDKLPNVGDSYLVLIKQKYDYEKEWEYHVDVAISYGNYIDDFWDTFIDWKEGQETHVIYWAKIPFPTDLIEKNKRLECEG